MIREDALRASEQIHSRYLKVIEAYKSRMYPTEEQETLLAKHFGSVRFVYNWALDYNRRQYAETRKHLGWMTIASSDDYKKLKADNQWLYEVGATTLQNTIGHLDKAFKRFFGKKGGFPRYKSKYDYSQSFEVPSGLKLDFRHGKIQIPKFLKRKGDDNRLKCVFSRKVKKGKLWTATVSRNACGVGGSGRQRICADSETIDDEAGKSVGLPPPISAVFSR